MKIGKTIDSKHLIASSSHWQSASEALVAGDIHNIDIPIPDINALPAITQHINNITSEQLLDLHGTNISINLHFNSHPETQDALSLLQMVIPTNTFKPSTNEGGLEPITRIGTTGGIPSITIAQGAEGGALIGGIGGAGVALLLQGIKSTADSIGNPILVTIGTVLAGIAAGAAGGAVFAKTSEYILTIGKDGVSVAAGT